MYATGPYKIVLEQLGYRDVKIEEAVPPQHVIDWARGDDKEMTAEQVADVNPYFRVTSAQGCFGIVIAPYIMLDTKDTGYNARNLGDTEAQDDTFLITSNDITLRRLKRLLEIVKH